VQAAAVVTDNVSVPCLMCSCTSIVAGSGHNGRMSLRMGLSTLRAAVGPLTTRDLFNCWCSAPDDRWVVLAQPRPVIVV
jgi:hypothetical protein